MHVICLKRIASCYQLTTHNHKIGFDDVSPRQKKIHEQSELYRIRHSAAHVMAQAVVEMFEPGEAKFAIGPPIENGFYYDFDLPRNLTPDDLKAIEKRMRQIIAQSASL